jgi:cobalt-zinc-cadmium efflux system outer membrane protein
VKRALASSSLALLAACASVDPKPAFQDVQKSIADRTGEEPRWSRTAEEAQEVDRLVAELLREELTPDRAVRVAFLSNPSLQATFEEIGISQADLAQAGRVANPSLSGFVRFPSEGSGTNTELSLIQDVFDVFMAPLRKKIASVELERSKLRVADEVLALAGEVKSAHFTLQARQQLVKRLRLVMDVTETAERFARRLHEAGNVPELELENQVALHRESKVDVARAEAEARADRERLTRLLGLSGPRTAFRIADQLPPIPQDEIPMGGLETLAITTRQDLQAARFGVDLVGRALALKKKTRFFPVGLSVGVSTEEELEGTRVTGPEISLQLPIFDTGKASVARLEAEHRRAQRQLEALAVNVRSEVREKRDRMLAARDLAKYYGETIVPHRVRILDLTLRYYNMMFKGAFDLLLAKQAEVEAEKVHVEAWRDYWIARAELERALGGALPGGAAVPAHAQKLER